MVDQGRSRSGLDRAASRLDAADDFGPTGRAGMVGEQPSGLASVNLQRRAHLCCATTVLALGRDDAGSFDRKRSQPTGRLFNALPEGAWGVQSGRRESGLAASASALHRFEQGSSHVGWHRK